MRESEALEILERLQGSEIRIEEVAEALRPAAGWDPEPSLPARVALYEGAPPRIIVDSEDHHHDWFIVDASPATNDRHPGLNWQRAIMKALVAAYNREREEEEMEEKHGAALDASIEKLCREAIDREVQKGVLQERARCLGVFDWLLSVIPRGWDFVRRYTEAARRKLESGEVPRPAVDWTGADDLPEDSPAEPERCEWPGCNLPALCRSGNVHGRLGCSEHFSVSNGGGESEQPEMPERLMFAGSGLYAAHTVTPNPSGVRSLAEAERAEVLRRWEAEPKLRLWKDVTAGLLANERKVRERLREERDGLRAVINRAADAIREYYPSTCASIDEGKSGPMRHCEANAYRILTGKEI